jgi:hypothetical protein
MHHDGVHAQPRVCPSCSETLVGQGELDELEREEFFRLKKVQGIKKKHADAKPVRNGIEM